jgi:hypothetical protein
MNKFYVALSPAQSITPLEVVQSAFDDHDIDNDISLVALTNNQTTEAQNDLNANSSEDLELCETTIFEVVFRPVRKLVVKRSYCTTIEEMPAPATKKSKR